MKDMLVRGLKIKSIFPKIILSAIIIAFSHQQALSEANDTLVILADGYKKYVDSADLGYMYEAAIQCNHLG